MTKKQHISDIQKLRSLIKGRIVTQLSGKTAAEVREIMDQDGIVFEAVNLLTRELSRQVCADHGLEKHFGVDNTKINQIPKDSILSEDAQKAFNAICLITGIDYMEADIRQSNVIELPGGQILSFENDRWYIIPVREKSEKFEILRSEAKLILGENEKTKFLTQEAWTDIRLSNQTLLQNEEM